MIDPITAISAATAAYKGVRKLVYAGRELEDIAGQLGKWYGAAADLRRAEQQRKNPPIFTKLFNSGSVEQEALEIIIHTKKLAEQEKDIEQLLNNRFGYGTAREMLELRRKIKKEREETLYKQQERKAALFEGILVTFLAVSVMVILFGGLWVVGLGASWW
jgi:hypothetical protein